LPWIAPIALAGLFAGWMMVGPRAAAVLGFLAGAIFFGLNFSWFGETAGRLLGPFGFLLDLAPAVVEALAFALTAALASFAARRLHGVWVPIAAAAGFTLTELLRSSGLLGVPLYQIGAAFVETPLAPLAAFGGVYALTFAVCLIGAALGAAARERDRRRAATHFGALAACVAFAALLTWWAWPARHLGPPTLRVAAVQGNITQSVKWQAASLPRAVREYSSLTAGLRAFKPEFILWPETVITTDLLLDPAFAAVPDNAGIVATGRDLRRHFQALADSLGAVIAVGSDEAAERSSFNDLFFFSPADLRAADLRPGDVGPTESGPGALPEAVYRKRQLVPFAEFLPGPDWLRALPFAALVSSFRSGTDTRPIDSRLRVGPLICWEAGFTGLTQTQAAAGARFFAVATDDAWFGDSDGPFAQAQIAQLRAIETGRWIVRAAATGISGIIAPNGQWQKRSALDTVAVVTGTIGEPQATLYSRLGPWPVGLSLVGLLTAAFGLGRRRQQR
jgi:apolipoprotein N-acyltransferase